MALEDYGATGCDVTATGRQECGTLVVIGGLDHERHQKHEIKPPVELERLDRRADRFDAVDVGEHLGRLVNRDDLVSEFDEPSSDASGSGTELEDRGARRDCAVDPFGLAVWPQSRVVLDGAAIRRDGAGPGAVVRG